MLHKDEACLRKSDHMAHANGVNGFLSYSSPLKEACESANERESQVF